MSIESQHRSSPAVGRHPDRPARHHVSVRQKEEPSEPNSGGFSSVLRACPLSLAIALGTGLVSVTVAAFILTKLPDPTALLPYVAVGITGLSSLAGGIAAGRCQKAHPVAASALAGGILTALLLLLSIFTAGESNGILPWIIRMGVLPVCIIGGILSRTPPRSPTHFAGKHPSRT